MPTRRQYLRLAALSSVGVAGCSALNQSDSDDSAGQSPDGDGGTTDRSSDDDTENGSAAADDTGDGSATDDDTETGDGTASLSDVSTALETVTTAPDAPLAFRQRPDGRYYIADRPGTIYLLTKENASTALDLTDTIMTGSERGLLGLALHPEFVSTRRLYVRYSSPPRSGTPSEYSHTFVLAEFTARDDGTIDPATEQTLLEIPEPQGNHNSGPIAFGPDGYLYVGVGDGGAGGDRGTGHVSDWYDANDGGNGQDITENLLGSLLRIDVDSGDPYAIPPDNPLVDSDGLDEQYAWGLRNPWGLSFDTGHCYLADVGQSSFEEVNRIEAGGNYGWNVREGAHCYGSSDCPTTTPDGAPLRDPIIEYPHDGNGVSGISITGGHVYRGERFPALAGRYVFGDLTGKLFVATPADEGRWPIQRLSVESSSQENLGQLLGIASDRDDQLFVLTPGGIHRLVSGN